MRQCNCLLACRWRGNVRELDNALQRAVILGEGPMIAPADLPPDLAPVEGDPALVDNLAEAVKRFEKQHIERILRQTPEKKEAAERWISGSVRCIGGSRTGTSRRRRELPLAFSRLPASACWDAIAAVGPAEPSGAAVPLLVVLHLPGSVR